MFTQWCLTLLVTKMLVFRSQRCRHRILAFRALLLQGANPLFQKRYRASRARPLAHFTQLQLG